MSYGEQREGSEFVCGRGREGEECVYTCVCVCVCMRERVCVCVCERESVWERERGDKGRSSLSHTHTLSLSLSLSSPARSLSIRRYQAQRCACTHTAPQRPRSPLQKKHPRRFKRAIGASSGRHTEATACSSAAVSELMGRREGE